MKRIEKWLIQSGDEKTNIEIILNLQEWKSIVNLLRDTLDEYPEMIGYRGCYKSITKQIDNKHFKK